MFHSRREAERFASRVEVEKERGEYRDPTLGRRTFGEVATTWRAQKSGLRPGTLSNYDTILKLHLMPAFEKVPVAKLTPDLVRTWVGHLRAKRVGDSTVAKAYRVLGAIMEMAVDDRLIPSSPVPTRHRPVTPEPAEVMFLTFEQVSDLAAAIDTHYEALVWTAAFTGMRFGELIGLTARRVDLLHRRIDVAAQITDVRGQLIYGPPKTKAGRRSIELPSILGDRLLGQVAGRAPDDLVFTTEQGGVIRQANLRKRIWLPALERSGLEGLRFHDLRHTHVAWLIAAGVEPLEITRRIGHTKVAFTLDRYGHLFPGNGTAADRLDALHGIQSRPHEQASVHQLAVST